jgi:hypothetical protein
MNDTRIRMTVHAGLICVAVLTTGLVLADVTGPARLIATLVAMSLLPGAAVLTRLPTADPAAWCGLAIAISLAIETILSLLMVWTHQWYPNALGAVLAASSALILLHDIRRTRTPARRAAP